MCIQLRVPQDNSPTKRTIPRIHHARFWYWTAPAMAGSIDYYRQIPAGEYTARLISANDDPLRNTAVDVIKAYTRADMTEASSRIKPPESRVKRRVFGGAPLHSQQRWMVIETMAQARGTMARVSRCPLSAIDTDEGPIYMIRKEA